jgi:signal transduction histidine kinase
VAAFIAVFVMPIENSQVSTAPALKARILVVDDETAHCRALVDLLAQQGYEAMGCASAREAIDTHDLAAFDLLITDLQMPGMSGLDLIHSSRVANPHLAAILMTGHASIDSAVGAMHKGAVDYIVKPFRLSKLLESVERALNFQQLRANNAMLQQILLKQNEELLLVNQELDAFAARLSHDLRGPVVNMRAVLSELSTEASGSLSAGLQQMVYMGIRSGDVALKMVRDLLDFARLGSRDLKMERVDLSELLEHTLLALRAQMPPQGCEVVIGPMPQVTGHEGLLYQAFINLVGNGIKYSAGHPQPRVQVTCETLSHRFHTICVSDNGVGFDPTQGSQLFKPFQRLHSETSFEGEGMGLANVKRIVERHGGQVSAEGRLGEGACFRVLLPRIDSDSLGKGSKGLVATGD